MAKYIETKVRSEQLQEDGTNKQVVDRYLVEADSFTEAEARIIAAVDTESVESVSRSNVRELFLSDKESDNVFYKAKVEFVSIDEKTMKEKRKSHVVLIQAADIVSAIERVEKAMSDTISDYEIVTIAKSPIIDFYGGERHV